MIAGIRDVWQCDTLLNVGWSATGNYGNKYVRMEGQSTQNGQRLGCDNGVDGIPCDRRQRTVEIEHQGESIAALQETILNNVINNLHIIFALSWFRGFRNGEPRFLYMFIASQLFYNIVVQYTFIMKLHKVDIILFGETNNVCLRKKVKQRSDRGGYICVGFLLV